MGPCCPLRSMWKSFPAQIACATPCTMFRLDICSCPTSGLTPTSSGCSSRSMNASACPTVGSRMSPRGSFGLGSMREAEVVAAVGHERAQQVHRLPVAVQRGPDVLGRVVLAALAPAPEHERARPELGGQLDVPQHLPQREPAHGPVVAGEPAVLEDGVGEEVGGDHRDRHAGLGERLTQPGDLLVAGARVGEEAEQVVVVEGEPPRAELGQPVHRLDDVQRRPGGLAERVDRTPADRPQPEREVVGGGGCGSHDVSQFRWNLN